MPRVEFTRKQRLEIWNRADGHCQSCGMKMKAGEGEYDHIIALAHGGETDVENGQLLCYPCHKPKTASDKGITEKIKRMRDKHLGIYPKSRARIQGRGFQKTR